MKNLKQKKLSYRKAIINDVRQIHSLVNRFAKKEDMLPRSLNEIYENIRDVGSERIRNLLEEGKNGAFLSKNLVTIRRDVPIDCQFDDYGIEGFPRKTGIDLLQEKELFVIANELGGAPPKEKKTDQESGTYYLIEGEEDLNKLKGRIRDAGLISIDTESTGKDPVTSKIIGLSISIEEGEGYYIPIMSNTAKAFDQ